MMVIAVGLSSYNVGLFHLVNHAYREHVKFYKLLEHLQNIAEIITANPGTGDNQQESYVKYNYINSSTTRRKKYFVLFNTALNGYFK